MTLFIELLSLALALSALLLQPRRDSSAPPSWKNLSASGRIVLFLIILMSGAKITKGHVDATARELAEKKRLAEIRNLQASNSLLLETNNRLVKIMSVANGYNAAVTGAVVFDNPVGEDFIRKALQNLFLKFAYVQIVAHTQTDVYHGKINYGAHPEVRLYRHLGGALQDGSLLKIRQQIPASDWSNAYFFEVRCANLKILNTDKILYARLDPNETLSASVETFSHWSDFGKYYQVKTLYVEKIHIEELEEIPINKTL